jgi:hypothetical protein
MRANDPAGGAPFVQPPPTADERLTGESGAELASRDLPTINPDVLRLAQEQGVASGTPGGPRVAALGATPDDPDALRRHYLQLLQTPPAEDANGRLKSGARMATTGIQPTDSIGNALGQIAGKFAVGLLRPESDEQVIDRPRELKSAQAAAQGEAALEGSALKRKEAQQEAELRAAQIKKTQVEAEELPKMNESRRQQGAQTRLISQLRVAGRYKRGENPELDRQIEAAGMNVSDFEKGGKFQWHTSGGQVYTMDATTGAIAEGAVNDKPIVDASKVPNAQGLTPEQAARDADRDADRASRERVARWRISASKEIAAASEAVQRDRLKLSADQFQKLYPGAGFTLTPEDIAKKAKAAGMLPEDAAKLAVKQGYTIQ